MLEFCSLHMVSVSLCQSLVGKAGEETCVDEFSWVAWWKILCYILLPTLLLVAAQHQHACTGISYCLQIKLVFSFGAPSEQWVHCTAHAQLLESFRRKAEQHRHVHPMLPAQQHFCCYDVKHKLCCCFFVTTTENSTDDNSCCWLNWWPCC